MVACRGLRLDPPEVMSKAVGIHLGLREVALHVVSRTPTTPVWYIRRLNRVVAPRLRLPVPFHLLSSNPLAPLSLTLAQTHPVLNGVLLLFAARRFPAPVERAVDAVMSALPLPNLVATVVGMGATRALPRSITMGS